MAGVVSPALNAQAAQRLIVAVNPTCLLVVWDVVALTRNGIGCPYLWFARGRRSGHGRRGGGCGWRSRYVRRIRGF